MSTVASCTFGRGLAVLRPPNSSSGVRVAAAAMAPLSSQRRRSRALSVCCVNNNQNTPQGEHNPKKDLPPFKISPVVLVDLLQQPGERWQLEEDAEKVTLWFEVPGQSMQDLVVEIDEDVLVIRKPTAKEYAARENNKNQLAGGGAPDGADPAAAKGRDGIYYARMFLPAGYNKESVKAELKSGQLKVTIGKIKKNARRNIKIGIE